ncbi:fumarylacetoacetate hydrolase family protein [Halobacillus sp. Marseille-P3879]|uniref:fumarylacetoacetate hydrolase family protein n=1 Tax=Halobacillus sp. Marseille-P3879 TaxID=2045014 RepID=UPI000C7C1DF1|nr:fumarylacetoacetate hydrolase family protein [Halobacillus sp. Marseille-P3879]
MPYAKAVFGGAIQESRIELPSSNFKATSDDHNDIEGFWNPPITGTIYGTLLNYRGSLEDMGSALHNDPYKSPPKAPVLYIKPRNTLVGHKGIIPIPEDTDELAVGASIGIVISKKATQITQENAEDYIEGYTIINDISIPHSSVFRPAIKEKARNGFCPVGPWVMEKDAIDNINDIETKVFINNDLKQQNTTKNLVRSVEELLQDVTEFMTLNKGDILMVGVSENPPIATKNDKVRIEVENIGVLENTIQ